MSICLLCTINVLSTRKKMIYTIANIIHALLLAAVPHVQASVNFATSVRERRAPLVPRDC
jgi:hypothetical protein